MARLLFGLGVAAVIFTIYAVADCAFFDRSRIRGLRRGWWIVIILFVPIIGGLLWFFIGRGRRNRIGATRGGHTVAPDDDMDFLKQLRDDAAQDERIRRMEAELAQLDDDEPRAGKSKGKGSERRADEPDMPDDPFEPGDTLGTERKRPDGPDAPGEAGPSGRPNG